MSTITRQQEYWSLSGEDGPSPIEARIAELEREIAELRGLLRHQHDWNDDGYCCLCGADGAA